MLKNIPPNSIGAQILARPIEHKANFDVSAVNMTIQGKKLLRKYFTPSEPNWGPKARATGEKK